MHCIRIAQARRTCSGWVIVMSSAATSQCQKSRPIAAIALQATSLAEFVESWRTLKRGLFDHYRPELHYMRGPGPKWREKHIAHGVEECANHPTYARAMLDSVAVRASLIVTFILFSGIALTVIPARASVGRQRVQAGKRQHDRLPHRDVSMPLAQIPVTKPPEQRSCCVSSLLPSLFCSIQQ
jgi:hypothetical protein